ncbi:Uncharacterized protein FKW44_016802 [Caligus rogercresseyi]|uniref:Uncharacterized protein n=1 Tax=Caligus rogercresseyi TaxID=217165 RepID=A0A7T8H2G7_CALRO|nr:Uncharacterized protein FKW44_016802 [Caligus rogercresseyi]
MGEDFVNIPNNVGKKRLYAPRSEGGLGMIDVEIHWSVLLISWLKRYPLVDHLWKNALSGAKSLSIPTLGPGNDKGPPNPPLHRPWNELWDFPQEILEAYWKEVGVGGPLVGNPIVKVEVPRSILQKRGLRTIKDVLSLKNVDHPSIVLLKASLRTSFPDGVFIKTKKNLYQVSNRIIKTNYLLITSQLERKIKKKILDTVNPQQRTHQISKT